MDVEHRLLILLAQLAVIILAARLFAVIFRGLRQPAAVGEIAAGLVLGPSLLGWLLPGFFLTLFPPAADPIGREVGLSLGVLSQLGLIFLLFLVGLEFDFSHLRANSRAAAMVSLSGIALPFTLGWLLAPLLFDLLDPGVDQRGFSLFLGTAMSITALPILGRMMQELGITRTRLGAITISSAAIDDAAGWILLAAVTAIVRARFDPWQSALMLAETVGFVLLMVFAARPLLARWVRSAMRRRNGALGLNTLAVLLAVLFLCAMATSWIGIFAIFGAFLLGAVLSGEREFRDAVRGLLGNFVTVFFLPIFFTYTGLRTDISALGSAPLWGLAALVSAAAIAGKLGGCALAARAGGLGWRESLCVGSMMNTRALMELVVINVGRDLGVIPPSIYCMLVLMALLTTVMTAPLLLAGMRGTELEAPIRASGFLGARGVGPRGPTPAP